MGQSLGCVGVKGTEVAVREHDNKFVKFLEPRNHYVPPCAGFKVSRKVSLAAQQLHVSADTKTKDNYFVLVQVMFQYRVNKEKALDADALYNYIADHDAFLRPHALNAIKAVVPTQTFTSLFESISILCPRIEERVREQFEEFGFDLLHAIITNIQPDDKTKKCLHDYLILSKQIQGEAYRRFVEGVGASTENEAIQTAASPPQPGAAPTEEIETDRDQQAMMFGTLSLSDGL